MKILGIVGWSGSGKTSLVTRLIPVLIARGLEVSTLKHAHHDFDVDQPGKDSHAHRHAGAAEVMISSGRRWALMHELRDEPELSLDALIARMTPVDLLLIEGFKTEAHDKIEVFRPVTGRDPLHPHDPHIVAVATDAALPDLDRPRLDLNDTDAIAAFIRTHCGLDR